MKWKMLTIAGVFALAMGFLESAVVVYIRALYYPDGFAFPLIMPDPLIFITELFREAATLIMIACAALMAARKAIERFAYFIYIFAVWDIFYYVFLKIILGWPAGISDWDILFFIPLTWTGPVIAPLINSACMILLALTILWHTGRKKKIRTGLTVWILLTGGSLLVVYVYLLDYVVFMTGRFSLLELITRPSSPAISSHAAAYVPVSFNWWLFMTGVVMHLAAIAMIYIINVQKKYHNKSGVKVSKKDL